MLPKQKKWERNNGPLLLFFPIFSPTAFAGVLFFFVTFFQALRCLQMPLSGFSIETRSERGVSHNENHRRAMSWSRCIYHLEMYPFGWWQLKGFFWLDPTPQKNLGKIRSYIFDLQKYVFSKMGWFMEPTKQWKTTRETWEVLQTTSTSLTNFRRLLEEKVSSQCCPVSLISFVVKQRW